MSGLFYLVFWTVGKTHSVVKHSEISRKPKKGLKQTKRRFSEGDVVLGVWGDKKYDAEILRISEDKSYLDTLRVLTNGQVVHPHEPTPSIMVLAKKRKVKLRQDQTAGSKVKSRALHSIEASALESNFLDAATLPVTPAQSTSNSTSLNKEPQKKSSKPEMHSVPPESSGPHLGSGEKVPAPQSAPVTDTSRDWDAKCTGSCQSCCSRMKFLAPLLTKCPTVTPSLLTDMSSVMVFLNGLRTLQVEHGLNKCVESMTSLNGYNSWEWAGPGKVELSKLSGIWIPTSELQQAQLKALSFKTNKHLELMRQLLTRILGEPALCSLKGAATGIPRRLLTACEDFCNQTFKVQASHAAYTRAINLYIHYKRTIKEKNSKKEIMKDKEKGEEMTPSEGKNKIKDKKEEHATKEKEQDNSTVDENKLSGELIPEHEVLDVVPQESEEVEVHKEELDLSLEVESSQGDSNIGESEGSTANEVNQGEDEGGAEEETNVEQRLRKALKEHSKAGCENTSPEPTEKLAKTGATRSSTIVVKVDRNVSRKKLRWEGDDMEGTPKRSRFIDNRHVTNFYCPLNSYNYPYPPLPGSQHFSPSPPTYGSPHYSTHCPAPSYQPPQQYQYSGHPYQNPNQNPNHNPQYFEPSSYDGAMTSSQAVLCKNEPEAIYHNLP